MGSYQADDHGEPITKPIPNYLSPQGLFDFCVNQLGQSENESYLNLLKSVIVENHIDSLNVHRVDMEEFALFMMYYGGNKALYKSSCNFWLKLLEKMGVSYSNKLKSVTWDGVVRAASHEMSGKIAQIIKEHSYWSLEDYKGTLLKATDHQRELKLTALEAAHLQSFMKRAMGKIKLIRTNASSYVQIQLCPMWFADNFSYEKLAIYRVSQSCTLFSKCFKCTSYLFRDFPYIAIEICD